MGIYQDLKKDLSANGRAPSLLSLCVSLFLVPGVLAVLGYRLSNLLYEKGLFGRVVGKIIWRVTVLLTGCYISPRCSIAGGLALPHPVGVVIGDDVTLGENVTVYQNTTLGTDRPGSFHYPKVSENAVIYSGAVVVGAVTIGAGSIVGANAVVTQDVPADSIAIGVPAVCHPRGRKR